MLYPVYIDVFRTGFISPYVIKIYEVWSTLFIVDKYLMTSSSDPLRILHLVKVWIWWKILALLLLLYSCRTTRHLPKLVEHVCCVPLICLMFINLSQTAWCALTSLFFYEHVWWRCMGGLQSPAYSSIKKAHPVFAVYRTFFQLR